MSTAHLLSLHTSVVHRNRFAKDSSRFVFAAIALLMLGATGCHAPGAIDLLKTNAVKVAVVPSRVVEFPRPSIWSEGNDLLVTGTVRRFPSATGMLAGHVDVTVLSHDGGKLEVIEASMSPPWIPADPPRQASYTARSSTRPPDGAIVQVAYRSGSHNSNCLSTEGGKPIE